PSPVSELHGERAERGQRRELRVDGGRAHALGAAVANEALDALGREFACAVLTALTEHVGQELIAISSSYFVAEPSVWPRIGDRKSSRNWCFRSVSVMTRPPGPAGGA